MVSARMCWTWTKEGSCIGIGGMARYKLYSIDKAYVINPLLSCNDDRHYSPALTLREKKRACLPH